MSTQLQLRRGTTAQHATFTGAEGEVTVDTTKDTVVVHDGTTAGGHPLAKEDHTHDGYQATLVSGTNIRTINGESILGRGDLEVTAVVADASTEAKGIIEIATVAEVGALADTVRAVTPATLPTGVKAALGATGDAPVYGVRAFGHYDTGGGINTNPSITHRNSGNVASFTSRSTGGGRFSVTFTNAMPTAYYAVSFSSQNSSTRTGTNVTDLNYEVVAMSTTGFDFNVWNADGDNWINPNRLSFMVVC